MGSFFKDVFEKLGFSVLVSDIGTKMTNKKLVKKSDIVFFSVPIHLTEKVINEVVPFTRKDQLLLDCTSLKTIPMRAMMKSPASVIGLHPMFRPNPLLGLQNQTFVLCKGRASKKQIKTVKSWFIQGGAKVIEMSAKEHDKLMSIIQVLIHFHAITLGNTFEKLGVSLKDTLKVASPIYRLEMDMIGRIFSQDPLLYAAIEMFNPETKRVTAALLRETEKLARIVLSKDIGKFKKAFFKTSQFLGDFKEKALEETNRLLKYL